MPPLAVERATHRADSLDPDEGTQFADSGIIIRTPAGRNPASAEKAGGAALPEAVGGIEIYEGPKRPSDQLSKYR